MNPPKGGGFKFRGSFKLYQRHCDYACCATKKDIAPENPDTTTVSGFFRAPIFKCKQKDIFLC